MEKNPKPTIEDIDKNHALFVAKLTNLFETHKHKYVENADKVQLEII